MFEQVHRVHLMLIYTAAVIHDFQVNDAVHRKKKKNKMYRLGA